MQSNNPSSRILKAIALPLVAQALLAFPLGALEVRGWHHLTEVVVLCTVATTTGGFLIIARLLTARQAMAVALVYYPIMMGLSFFVFLTVGMTLRGGYL
jgi:hypothetical protein